MSYTRYSYNGPVEVFGKCATQKWSATTYAVNAARARSNLIFQYKKQFNLVPTAKVTLPGVIEGGQMKGVV